MAKIVAVSFFLALALAASGQVEKKIFLGSVPEKARITALSGGAEYIGNTPLNNLFSFHSDMSLLRVRLTACGYYDSIVRITPKTDSLRVIMEKKKFLILPDSASDSFNETEHRYLSTLLKAFLEAFSRKNSGQPVNYVDFAIFRKTGDRHIVSLAFEVEPDYLRLPRSADSDSIMVAKWNELFSSALDIFNAKQFNSLKNTDFFFSLMAGERSISVRHLPGIEQNDELRTQTTTYEGDRQRVTITQWYYETVTSPTFNTSLNQSVKYSEILFRISRDEHSGFYSCNATGAQTFSNNRVSVVYESYPGFCTNSMLKKFINIR